MKLTEFVYRAKDKHGSVIKGKIEASGEQAALERMDALEYMPIFVKKVEKRRMGLPVPALVRRGVPRKTLIVFTRQLSTMVKTGLPILTALTVLYDETENKHFKAAISNIRSDIQEGLSLSEAMERHPYAFSKLYSSTISAGEAGGVLDKVLFRLAELLEHEAQLQANIKSALRYPAIVVSAIFAAFFVLTIFVVPAFARIYEGAGAALPVPTQILIATNILVRRWWYVAVPAGAAVAGLLNLYMKSAKGKFQWDYLKLRLPIFGKLIMKSISSRFAQMLRTLDEAGLPILRSLEEIADTLGNEVISRDLATVREAVQDGRGLGQPLLASGYFPALMGHMIIIGERSGEMGEMLQSVQEHYDLEVDVTVKNLTTLIEPFLIFGLGIIVIFIALGIFLPMWDLISIYTG